MELKNIQINKKQVVGFVNLILANQWDEKELIHSLLNGDDNTQYFCSWIISDLSEIKPDLLNPFTEQIIAKANSSKHLGVKRNLFKAIQFIEKSDSIKQELGIICLNCLQNPKETIAVKSYSITILEGLIVDFPEFLEEVNFELEKQLPNATPAFASRAHRFLKKVKKLKLLR
jgi:hypothetical protein